MRTMGLHVNDFPSFPAKEVRRWFKATNGNPMSAPVEASWNGKKGLRLEAQSLELVTFRYAISSRSRQAVRVVCHVALEWLPCRFGGQRPYFVCPRCGKRATVVRLTWHGVACRRCIGAGYLSQSLSRIDRLQRKAAKAKAKLPRDGRKPKWMHWNTFDRLIEEERRRRAEALEAWTASAHAAIERLNAMLAKLKASQQDNAGR